MSMSKWMRGLRVVLKYRYHLTDDLSGKGWGCVHPRPSKALVRTGDKKMSVRAYIEVKKYKGSSIGLACVSYASLAGAQAATIKGMKDSLRYGDAEFALKLATNMNGEREKADETIKRYNRRFGIKY